MATFREWVKDKSTIESNSDNTLKDHLLSMETGGGEQIIIVQAAESVIAEMAELEHSISLEELAAAGSLSEVSVGQSIESVEGFASLSNVED